MRAGTLISTLVLLSSIVGLSVVWAAGSYLVKPVPAEFNASPKNAMPVNFDSESGSHISGWIYSAEKPSAAAVLMHGVRSNRMQMVSRAEHLQKMGISALVFDFQAHGASPGKMITLGYLESYDAQAAVGFMKSLFPKLPIVVIGASMGGAASVLAEPALDVNVLILESVYSDVTTAISNRLDARLPGGRVFTPLLALQIEPRAGIRVSDLSPAIEAGRVRASTLVMSGDLDRQTTMSDTKLLYGQLPGPKSLEIFAGAGHVDLEYFDPDKYWDIVEPFMREHLIGDE